MTVAVVGAGLIGTSVALAVRRRQPEARVIMLDRGDSFEAIAGADLVVLAAPVGVIIHLLETESDRLRDRVVTDVGSTKRAIVRAAREVGLSHFVGGHPMAGAAASGPGAARGDLFDGRPWFLVPRGALPDATARVREFVTLLGAHAVMFDDDGAAHDRLMAAVSHLPQVTASSLMALVGDAVGSDGLAWAGAGLRDTTRLAASASSIWRDVLATNADEVRPLLLALADALRDLAGRLDDDAAVDRLFASANRHRASLDGEGAPGKRHRER
jgi:prephenate dehydrogenase